MMEIRRREPFFIKIRGAVNSTIITTLPMPKEEVKVKKEGGGYVDEKEGGKKRPAECVTLE